MDKFIIIDDNDEVFEIKTKSIIYFEINTDEVYIETKKFGVELAICKNNLMPIIDFFMPLVLN